MRLNPLPTGDLQGDGKAMPDRGTSTGATDTYGADIAVEATNRLVGISGATRSDAPFAEYSGDNGGKGGDDGMDSED